MVVMPGLEPGIYVSCIGRGDIDGRISPGHDEGESRD
jgi:hypothetical protein